MTPVIPVGPEARRLRLIFEAKSGATPSSGVEEYWNGDINWVTPEDLGKLERVMNFPPQLAPVRRQAT